jgi:hypothetical protein
LPFASWRFTKGGNSVSLSANESAAASACVSAASPSGEASLDAVNDDSDSQVGAKMLLTFRLFLVAAGLVILALAMTAHGLVPEPDVRTRIGEVPSMGRSLVQQAIVTPGILDRLSAGPASRRAEEPVATREPSDPSIALAPAAGHPGQGTSPAPELSPSAESQEARPDCIGELVTVTLAETPEPTPPREIDLDFYKARRPPSSLDGTTPDQAYFTPLPLRLAA